MASLAGLDEAKDFSDKAMASVPKQSRERLIERVQWSHLTFILGPLITGHHDGIRESQENDDGSDGALWLEHARETAEAIFLSSKADQGSLLDVAFGQKVVAKRIFVGRSYVEGRTVAATTINLRDIVLENGFPVYWKPDTEALNALASTLGALEGREWIRWAYAHH